MIFLITITSSNVWSYGGGEGTGTNNPTTFVDGTTIKPQDPTLSFGLTGSTIDSSSVIFDPSTSGLTKTNVQDELEELAFSSLNVAVDTSPLVPWITYHVDASGSDIIMTLPDVVAGNDDSIFKIFLAENTNNTIITTVSGTQLIGMFTSQTIVNEDKGITVQADFGSLKYHIIQDSRPSAVSGSITYLGLTEASGVSTYLELATSTDDPNYSLTPTDAPSGSITGSAQNLINWVSAEGSIIGNNGTTVSCSGNLRRTGGSGTASFYTEIYHRTSGGTETIIGTTGNTPDITTAIYNQFTISGVLNVMNFGATDRLLVKFYGNRTGGGSDPDYDIQLEGTQPAQCTIAIPTGAIAHDSLAGINQAGAGIANGHINASAQSIVGAKTFTDLSVDNINIDANTISSTDTDGDILLLPDGAGGVGNIDDLAGYSLRFNTTGSLLEDQANISTNATSGITTTWQSFTSGVNGLLDNVEILMSGTQQATIITVTIKTGTGTGGSTLATLTGLVLATGWNVATFPTSPLLTNGSTYSIITTKTGGPSVAEWLYRNTDVYAGGVFVLGGDGGFKTNMILSVDLVQEQTDGFFGINELTPTEMLDVGGNIQFSGSLISSIGSGVGIDLTVEASAPAGTEVIKLDLGAAAVDGVALSYSGGAEVVKITSTSSDSTSAAFIYSGGGVNSLAGHAFEALGNGIQDTHQFKIFEADSTALNVQTARGTSPFDIRMVRTRNSGGDPISDDYSMAVFDRQSSTDDSAGVSVFNSAGAVVEIKNTVTQDTGTLNDSVILLEIIQDSDSTGDVINIKNGATEVFVIEDGGGFNHHTSDPCPTRDAGYVFYNSVSGYLCICNNPGADVKVSDEITACY